jgi:hypothetical protein
MMAARKQRKGRAVARARNGKRWQWLRTKTKGEEGQGLVEAAAAFCFLLVIVLVMFEAVMIFSSYNALLNAAVQGAIYAAGHPTMVSSPPDSAYQKYVSTLQAEVVAGGLSWTDITIHPPQLPATIAAGNPLTVTVDYELTTFASEIVMPLFGRFGLPTHYSISARTAVPIR